jgi:Tol biopolymer transport system component
MTGIFINICRHSFLTVVALLLFGSTVTSTAQTLRRNGKIAFTSDRDGNSEIYTINPDGSDLVRLTNNAGVDSYPTWSPDGRMIAFISETPADGVAIFRMNEDGTNKTLITPISSSQADVRLFLTPSLSWSPDGGRIAFQDTDPVSTQRPNWPDIFVVNVDGSNPKPYSG